jgi:hypothetical protein
MIACAQSGHEPALQLSARPAISTGAWHRPQLHELRIAVDQWPRRQREALRRKTHPDAKQDDQVRRTAAIDDRLRGERRPLGHEGRPDRSRRRRPGGRVVEGHSTSIPGALTAISFDRSLDEDPMSS